MNIRSVFKGASIYSGGQILIKASGFFLIPVYTRVLTPHDYGVIGYLQVFLSIMTVIVGFGFNGAQTRYYYENKESQKFADFGFTINFIPTVGMIIIGIPLSILSIMFDWKIADIPVNPFFIITYWTVLFQVIAGNALGYYRATQQFAKAAIYQVIRFLLITMFSILLVVTFKFGALGRIWGMLLGLIIFGAVSFPDYFKEFRFRFSFKALKYATLFGVPIVFHLLAGTIHNAIDRVMLERYVDFSEVGIYTLGFTIGNTLGIFVSAFNKAFQPSYFKLMSNEDEVYREKTLIKIFRVWLLLITAISTVAILLGGPFIRIFAGEMFRSTTRIFPWIIYSLFLGSFYYFFASPLFYFKKTVFLPIITGLSALANILLNLIFIPIFGIVGAAIATAISHLLQSVIAYFVGRRYHKVKWPFGLISISVLVQSLVIYLVVLK